MVWRLSSCRRGAALLVQLQHGCHCAASRAGLKRRQASDHVAGIAHEQQRGRLCAAGVQARPEGGLCTGVCISGRQGQALGMRLTALIPAKLACRQQCSSRDRRLFHSAAPAQRSWDALQDELHRARQQPREALQDGPCRAAAEYAAQALRDKHTCVRHGICNAGLLKMDTEGASPGGRRPGASAARAWPQKRRRPAGSARPGAPACPAAGRPP